MPLWCHPLAPLSPPLIGKCCRVVVCCCCCALPDQLLDLSCEIIFRCGSIFCRFSTQSSLAFPFFYLFLTAYLLSCCSPPLFFLLSFLLPDLGSSGGFVDAIPLQDGCFRDISPNAIINVDKVEALLHAARHTF